MRFYCCNLVWRSTHRLRRGGLSIRLPLCAALRGCLCRCLCQSKADLQPGACACRVYTPRIRGAGMSVIIASLACQPCLASPQAGCTYSEARSKDGQAVKTLKQFPQEKPSSSSQAMADLGRVHPDARPRLRCRLDILQHLFIRLHGHRSVCQVLCHLCRDLQQCAIRQSAGLDIAKRLMFTCDEWDR